MNRTIQTLLVLMGSLSTVAATDIFLPSLPTMAVYFGVSEDAIQLAIPLYMLGCLLAAPVLGILSDNLGRRPVMLSGLGLFIGGTLFCLYSSSLPFFLTGRFIQGFGAVVSPVVGWAIIQDLYKADESAKIMSFMGTVISVGPFIAPGLGGYVHVVFGWQGNFVLIVLWSSLTLILMLLSNPKQKHPKGDKKSKSFNVLTTYKIVIMDLPFLGYISLFGFLICGQWAYLTLIPFYFQNTLKLSPDVFGLYLSGSASFYILGTFSTAFILNRFGTNKTLKLGLLISVLGSGSLVCMNLLFSPILLFIALAIGLYFFGAAIIWGPSTSRALQRFEGKRGAASAVRSLMITAAMALGGFIGSLLDDASIVPLSFLLLAMAIACWIVLQRVLKFT